MKNYYQQQEPYTQNEYHSSTDSTEQPYQGYAYQQQQAYQPPLYNTSAQQPFPHMVPFGDAILSGVLSYSLCWFTGIIFCLFGWHNRFVRFHALQSLLFFGAVNVIDIALITFVVKVAHTWHPFSYLFVPAALLFMLVNFIAFIAWIVGMIQAARGRYFRLPFVGDIVAQIVNGDATVK